MLTIRVKLYFAGRATPVQFVCVWGGQELPVPDSVTAKLAKTGGLQTLDDALVSWDPNRIEFASVELVERKAE